MEQNNECRRELTALYRELLYETRLLIPFENYRGISSTHILPVLLPHEVDRASFVEQTKQMGIHTSIHFPPTRKFSAYNTKRLFMPHQLLVTKDVTARKISLPIYPMLMDVQISLVVQSVREAAAGL